LNPSRVLFEAILQPREKAAREGDGYDQQNSKQDNGRRSIVIRPIGHSVIPGARFLLVDLPKESRGEESNDSGQEVSKSKGLVRY